MKSRTALLDWVSDIEKESRETREAVEQAAAELAAVSEELCPTSIAEPPNPTTWYASHGIYSRRSAR